MKEEGNKPVKEMPNQGKLEKLWGELLGTPTEFNFEAPWLTALEQEYAVSAIQTEYQITDKILDRVITKMANDKPGTDSGLLTTYYLLLTTYYLLLTTYYLLLTTYYLLLASG